jgi:hypothetical protein
MSFEELSAKMENDPTYSALWNAASDTERRALHILGALIVAEGDDD